MSTATLDDPPVRTPALREVARGAAAAVPLAPGNLAWGLAFGAAAVAVGLHAVPAAAMSALAYSGTAQLAAMGMLGQPPVAIFLTSLLLSLRFAPMTFALAALLPGASRLRRALAAVTMADASFALVAAGRVRTPAAVGGTWLVLYPTWVLGTVAGALGAPLLPRSLLAASDGMVAVIFAVLAVELCTDRRRSAVAAVAAVAAGTAALFVPGPVALPAAALLATSLGLAVRR